MRTWPISSPSGASFCRCGLRMIEAPAPAPTIEQIRKNQRGPYSHRLTCPRRRWWRPFHDSLLVTRDGVKLNEAFL